MMAWHTGTFFLSANSAVQFSVYFGTSWPGPQFIVPKLESQQGGDPASPKILVLQWLGTATEPVGLLGGHHHNYYVGIHNTSDSNIWFHLEGGGVT
jgi:hypothetical protein